jgi:hypothetical protein
MPARPQRPAARVIAAAAQPILAPLGCRQKGHSPLWIADQGFWLILAEFQPRAADEPSHLSVGAFWLWSVQSTLSFDYGRQFTDFAAYRDDGQFADVARDMARRAVGEIAAIRTQFAAMPDIARHLAAAGGDGFWPLYHAAVASGLAGDAETAQSFFRRLAEKPAGRAWEATLQADAGALARHLPDPAAFRAAAIGVINRARALHGLPAVSSCVG